MKKILIALAFISLLIFAGCTQTIKEVKKDENVGKVVSVRGTVENTIKFGGLSGYTLKDQNGDTIGVASKALPKEADTITAEGVLIKAPILGFYIDVDK